MLRGGPGREQSLSLVQARDHLRNAEERHMRPGQEDNQFEILIGNVVLKQVQPAFQRRPLFAGHQFEAVLCD